MLKAKVHVTKLAGRDHLALRWNEPGTRVVRQKSAGTTNRIEAERLAALLEAKLNAGKRVATKATNWEAFRERVEDERLVFCAVGTAGPVRSILNHIEKIVRPRSLNDLTSQSLSLVFSRLKDKGFKASTMSGHRAHLRSLLNWAHSQGMISTMPELPRIRMPKGTPHMKGRPVTGAEFIRMLRAVRFVRPKDSRRWRRYLIGLWRSGLRVAESLALTWSIEGKISIDLSGRFPRLRISAEAEKGRRDRILPMTPDFATWILRTPESRREGWVFSLPGRAANRHMSVKRVSRVVAAIGKAADIIVNESEHRFASAHDLRRAFGTRWSLQVHASELMLLMRHESIETTLRYYVGHEADQIAARLWQGELRSVRLTVRETIDRETVD